MTMEFSKQGYTTKWNTCLDFPKCVQACGYCYAKEFLIRCDTETHPHRMQTVQTIDSVSILHAVSDIYVSCNYYIM